MQLRDRAVAMLEAHELIHGKPYQGPEIPGRWMFGAAYYRTPERHQEISWFIRAMYVIVGQNIWANVYLFGVCDRQEFVQWYWVTKEATMLLWYERGPKALMERQRLIHQ